MEKQFTLCAIGAALFGMLLAGCTGDTSDAKVSKPESTATTPPRIALTGATVAEIGITTSRAAIGPIAGTMAVPARLLPNQNQEAQVGSLVQGRVKEVFAEIGNVVRKDQTLMSIEGLEVGEIKSRFIKAKAELMYEEANYQRQKTLLEQKVGSHRAFLEAQANYNKAVAGFAAEDKRIHSVGLTDSDVLISNEDSSRSERMHSSGVLPVRAPIAGTVVERNVVIGQLVDASTTAFRIINTSTLWADGQIYEKDIPLIGTSPDIALTVTAFPAQTFQGKIIYIAPSVDERTRTVTIRASIPNPHGRLKPQMFGELRLPLGGSRTGLLIPTEALQKEDTSTYVFVALDDTTFEQRSVDVGVMFDSRVEVKKGLQPGERVVEKGAFQLKSEILKEALEGGD
jgi:membrane fusion protein, heavy metal efflux system